MIDNSSRYSGAKTTVVDGPSGARMTIVPGRQVSWAFNFTYYAMKDGDRIDLLALDLYGDGSLWWKIADANPAILDWTDITVGTILRLPSG